MLVAELPQTHQPSSRQVLYYSFGTPILLPSILVLLTAACDVPAILALGPKALTMFFTGSSLHHALLGAVGNGWLAQPDLTCYVVEYICWECLTHFVCTTPNLGTVGVVVGGPLAVAIMGVVWPATVRGDQVWRGLAFVAGEWIGTCWRLRHFMQ